ncbi:MAG: hypothetical protein ACJ0GF_05285 [Burkholderiales bacterium]
MAVFIQRVSNKKIAASIIIGLIISCVGLPGLSFSTAPDVLALIIFYWAMLGGDNRPRLGTVFFIGLDSGFSGRPNNWAACFKVFILGCSSCEV